MHTGEEPYSCDTCPKKFARSGDLKCHKMLHTGEKPYSCDFCAKKFTRPSYLTVHKISSHTKETVTL